MPSVILAGTTTGTALSLTSDTSGELQIRTNNGATTALTLTTGGAATFTAGTVSAPAITTTGDTNTGLYFPSADVVSLTAGGVQLLRAAGTGEIDIPALTTETRILNIGVGRTGNGFSVIDLIGDATYSDFGLRVVRGDTGANATSSIIHRGTGQLALSCPEAGTINFFTSNAERMRIDSSGNVGIGTSTPGGFRLNVAGSIISTYLQVNNGTTNEFVGMSLSNGYTVSEGISFIDSQGRNGITDSHIFFGHQADNGSNIRFATQTAGTNTDRRIERMRIDSNGNVGIGTTTMTGRFNVSTTANTYGLFVTDGTRSGGLIPSTTTGGLILYNGLAQPLGFWTNNTERLRIDSSGNISQISGVGIKYDGVSGTNFVAFKWSSPNVIARIDNAVDVTLANVSDYRIKRNIETMTSPAIERVMALRPVTYQMADYGNLFKAGEDIKEGFIAHEVQEVIPSGTEGVKDDENQIQSLRLDAILAVAIKAIQELNAKLDAQAVEIAALKAK